MKELINKIKNVMQGEKYFMGSLLYLEFLQKE